MGGDSIVFVIRLNDTNQIFQHIIDITIQLDAYVGKLSLSQSISDKSKPYYLKNFTNSLKLKVKQIEFYKEEQNQEQNQNISLQEGGLEKINLLREKLSDNQVMIIGHKFYELIEMVPSIEIIQLNKINVSFYLTRNSNFIKEILFCFIDTNTNKIIDTSTKLFDYVEIRENGQQSWTNSFEELVYLGLNEYNNNKSNIMSYSKNESQSQVQTQSKMHWYKIPIQDIYGGELVFENNTNYYIEIASYPNSIFNFYPNQNIRIEIFGLYGYDMIYWMGNNDINLNSNPNPNKWTNNYGFFSSLNSYPVKWYDVK